MEADTEADTGVDTGAVTVADTEVVVAADTVDGKFWS